MGEVRAVRRNIPIRIYPNTDNSRVEFKLRTSEELTPGSVSLDVHYRRSSAASQSTDISYQTFGWNLDGHGELTELAGPAAILASLMVIYTKVREEL